MAQAKADVAITQAQTEIEVTEIQRKAAARFVEEETRHQTNMENIVAKAIAQIGPNAQAENMDDDWIENFFDKCRNFSDEQMQTIWSRILAGEANAPGSFSRKTVNVLVDFDKDSAEMFVILCRFGWVIGGSLEPIVFDTGSNIYGSNGLTFEVLGHLESLGLVQLASLGIRKTNLPKTLNVTYHDRHESIELPQLSENTLPIGIAAYTLAGRQLASIVSSNPVPGFYEFVYDSWAEQSLVPPRHDTG